VGARESWQWSAEALRCGASRQEAAALRAVLAHRWVVVAGDSIGRFFFAALLRLLSNNRAWQLPLPALARPLRRAHRCVRGAGSGAADSVWAPEL